MPARYMQPLRILIQCCFLGFIIWLGLRFYQFVQAVSSTGLESRAVRPDGIDGFLPISGLAGTVSWLKGGGINYVHPAAVIIFMTVVLVSLLLRRSFCSWICPVAVISECSWKGGFSLLRRIWRLPAWLDAALRGLKYLLMAFFIYFIAVAMSSDALSSFIQSDYHMISDVRLMNFFLHMSPLALGIVLALVALSVVLRNPFCRYLCPYGALLGLVAMFFPMRVTRNSERCVSCGVCSQVCPTYIDVMHLTSVASPECIACWRCISHCRFNGALSMRFTRRFAVPGFVFAALVVLLFLGGTVIGKLSGHWHSSVSLEEYVRLLGK
ncbi:MAG: 4Fe-4S binding protein [Desulfuromonadaceae bacterium]|nr:4Fe-4S binding protein [Desulfuromonadaceae bacterium]